MKDIAKLSGKERLVLTSIIQEVRAQNEAVFNQSTDGFALMNSLLEIPAEARKVCLTWLQRRDTDDTGRLVNFFHDLNGLANHDKFFLPRIKELQEFAK